MSDRLLQIGIHPGLHTEAADYIAPAFSQNPVRMKYNRLLLAQQTSAMHQLAIWTMLEDAGFGASLQHYNPLIDEAVAKQWHINPSSN